MNDLDGSRVLYVAQDRAQASLDGFWKTLTPAQLAGIEGVAIDMWDAFENSIRQHVPDAADKIVYDRRVFVPLFERGSYGEAGRSV